MNEIGFWSNHVKPALHSKHMNRVAWKVGTSTRAGIPDVIYKSPLNEVAWIELKHVESIPKRKGTPLRLGLSVEQRAHLREWADGGGHAFVLVLIGHDVALFPWYVPDVIQRDNFDNVVIFKLPLKDCKTMLGAEIDKILTQGAPNRPVEGVFTELTV